ncbi:MAG TPA: ATP-binding cassette domain-containing protein, partial [Ilumatobacter sp.]|nr:ATP-binding cassette domain-containing protein [Ilumatobacter sp.]
DGQPRVRGESLGKPRADIGMMFQTPVLFPWRTVAANVMLPGSVLKLDRARQRQRTAELLELVGLAGFEDRYPNELSGGMKQRVALARLLAYDPEVLLMDEPFGALDEFTREALDLELLRVWSATKKTVVFVTHNISEAVFLSDRVFVMTPRPGRLEAVVDVDLPRPRGRDAFNNSRFHDHVREIREIFGVAD